MICFFFGFVEKLKFTRLKRFTSVETPIDCNAALVGINNVWGRPDCFIWLKIPVCWSNWVNALKIINEICKK